MSTRMTDAEAQAKVEKLPLWAKTYIERLERKVKDAERVAQDSLLATKPDETNTVINPYEGTIGLPSSGRVRFVLRSKTATAAATADERRHDRWIDVHVHADGSRIELMASETLHITPQASNVLYVNAERW